MKPVVHDTGEVEAPFVLVVVIWKSDTCTPRDIWIFEKKKKVTQEKELFDDTSHIFVKVTDPGTATNTSEVPGEDNAEGAPSEVVATAVDVAAAAAEWVVEEEEVLE